MAVIAPADFKKKMDRRKWQGRAFFVLCLLSISIALSMLAALLIYILVQGWSHVNWSFITSFPSRDPAQAGIRSALLGSVYLVIIAGAVSFVLGWDQPYTWRSMPGGTGLPASPR